MLIALIKYSACYSSISIGFLLAEAEFHFATFFNSWVIYDIWWYNFCVNSDEDELLNTQCPRHLELRWQSEVSSSIYASPLVADINRWRKEWELFVQYLLCIELCCTHSMFEYGPFCLFYLVHEGETKWNVKCLDGKRYDLFTCCVWGEREREHNDHISMELF